MPMPRKTWYSFRNDYLLDFSGMKYIFGACALILALSIGAAPGAAAPSGKERRQEAAKEGFWTAVGTSFTYDDNVFNLSREDLELRRAIDLNTGSAGQKRFNRMESVNDGIIRVAGGLYEQSRPFGEGFSTRLGVDLEYFTHTQNTIKDHPVLRSFVRQYLTADHYLEPYYAVTLNQFERNYIGQVSTTTRFAGNYNTRAWGLLWDGHFGGVGLGLSAEYHWDRYGHGELEYRNAVGAAFGTHVDYRWSRWFYTRGEYRFQRTRAARSPFSDRSSDEHRFGATAEFIPAKKTTVALGYLGRYDHYTSKLGAAADLFFAGRRDILHDISLRAAYRLNAHWDFWGEYRRLENLSSLNYVAGDDSLRYSKNLVSVGVNSRWDLGVFSFD